MSSMEKRVLVASVAEFLHNQLAGEDEQDNLSSDARESLEVGVRCLEAAYEISGEGAAVICTVDVLKLVQDHLAANSPDALQLKNEGKKLMDAEKYKEALECFTKAIQIDNTNPVFFFNRATAHMALSDNEQAVKDCLSALAIDPNYSEAHNWLGTAYANLARLQEAHAAFTSALRLEPDNEKYRDILCVFELTSPPPEICPGAPHRFGNMLQDPEFREMVKNTSSEIQNTSLSRWMETVRNISVPVQMYAAWKAGMMLSQRMEANPDLVEEFCRIMQQASSDDEDEE